MILVHDTLSDGAFQMCEVLSQYLEQIWSYRADTTCDRQTDAEGKTIMSPNPDRVDIINHTKLNMSKLGGALVYW